MVFNSVMVVAVATLSADWWQYVSCNPERLRSDEILDLICCFPLQQLGRLALCIWSFFCFPGPDSYYASDSDSSSDSYYDSDNSHSD